MNMSRARKWGIATMIMILVSMPMYGWDKLGHMAAAYVAYQHLNAPTKKRVDQLLQLNPDYSKWKAKIPGGTTALSTSPLSSQ